MSFPLRTDIPLVVADLRKEQAHLLASLRYTNLNFKTFLPLYLRHTLNPKFPLHSAYRYLQAEQCGDPGYRVLAGRNTAAVEKYLQSLRAMERMARNEEKIATLEKQQEVIEVLGSASVPAEIQGLRIGDAVFITAPMEILSETGLHLRKMSPFRNTFLASLSNGYLHYAPPASYYERGGYESTECFLDPEWETIFTDATGRIFAKLEATDC